MSERKVRAWAVVDKDGNLAWESDDFPLIRRAKHEATELLQSEFFPGERVVPVTIIVEEK